MSHYWEKGLLPDDYNFISQVFVHIICIKKDIYWQKMWIVLLKVRFVNREEALTKAWKFLFHQKLANFTSINLALVLAVYFHNTLTKSTKFARYLIIMHLVSWPIAIIFLIGQTRKNQENHFIFPSFGEKLELFHQIHVCCNITHDERCPSTKIFMEFFLIILINYFSVWVNLSSLIKEIELNRPNLSV